MGFFPKFFILSHKYLEKSRLYSFAWRENSSKVAFVKTTFDKSGAEMLHHERLVLEHVQGKIGNIFIPSLLTVIYEGETFMLAQTLVPDSFSILNKASIPFPVELFESLRQYEGLTTRDNNTAKYSWWSAFEQNAPESYFCLVNRIIEREIVLKTCFAHGDLGSENIFYDKKTKNFYVIDWECWAPDAPYYADQLAYWLGQNNTVIRRDISDVKKLTGLFYEKFINAEGVPEDQALFALAFIVARNFNLAIIVSMAVAAMNLESSE